MKIFLAAIAIALFGLVASQPTLFAQIDRSDNSDTAVTSHLVNIDPSTGLVFETAPMFVEANVFGQRQRSIPFPVSTMDTLNKVYYYTPNLYSTFIFRGNIQSGSQMPPIAFNLDFVSALTFDTVGKRVLIAGVPHATNDLMLVASPVTNDPLSVVANLTALSGSSYAFSATVDTKNGIYYWVSLVQINETYDQIRLNQFYFNNPNESISYPVCGPWQEVPQRIFYDGQRQKIVMFTISFDSIKFSYFVNNINLKTGACQRTAIQLSDLNSDWAYDVNSQLAYTMAGYTVYTFDATSGKMIHQAYTKLDSRTIGSLEFVHM